MIPRDRSDSQRYRLTASTIARYFKHRCDRLFRWDTVETGLRGRQGIGWNVPARVRSHSRPGIRLLMEMGDEFEISRLQQLIEEVGEEQVRHAGLNTQGGRTTVVPLALSDFLECLRQQPLPTYIAQVEINLGEDFTAEAQFLQRFGLNQSSVKVGVARPDLLEVLAPAGTGEPYRLQIWDFKATQAARHEHFIQVAYYSLILEQVLESAGVPNVVLDTGYGTIFTREGKEQFELAPYRLAVADFLRNRAPALFTTSAADAHYHVCEKCAMCEYMDHCRSEADAHFDLSRIAYLSSESKRHLRRAGIANHRDLARLSEQDHDGYFEELRSTSHDLAVNLNRYMATAQAFEDGVPRPLEASTLQMPRYEDVRIIVSAEHDPVTGTCFALGIKTYEGWDEAANRPLGIEEVFVAQRRANEVDMLLPFLQTLNGLLNRLDLQNRGVRDEPIDQDPAVRRAQETLDKAAAAQAQFKAIHNPIRKTNPRYVELLAQRQELAEAERQAERDLKQVRRNVQWEQTRRQQRLHFYIYDRLDLIVLRELIERHLFDVEPQELLDEIRNLVRLFPPESVLPDADTFRSIPGTVVIDVLRTTIALPVPYLYSLQRVSDLYQPTNTNGVVNGYRYRPRYGFGWEHSNQVAFERIHDVWNGESWAPDSREPNRIMTPEEIAQAIDLTIRNKLRATDSVVRRLKQDLGDRLLLRKEPFQLYSGFDPIDFRTLEALRVFSLLESSLDELNVKHLHTLPVEDRAAKFEAIRGLQYVSDADDGSMWFTYDPGSRDAKFEVGDFNLAITPEDQPELLLGEIDGELFNATRWRHEPFQVTITELDVAANPPRVRLKPRNAAKLRERLDLSRPFVLDQLHVDYNTRKVLEVLDRLHTDPERARQINELLSSGSVQNWLPPATELDQIDSLLRRVIDDAGLDPERALNSGQWQTLRGVYAEPLTMIWGPPGTGKTYLLAHILLGYALAAAQTNQSIRILVTAFTHRAIINVLQKVAELANRYRVPETLLLIAKAQGTTPNAADEDLPARVERISDREIGEYLGKSVRTIVVGSTVWGVFNSTSGNDGQVQQWFDVTIVDEASQLRLPDALVALSANNPNSNIILAGDDRQLPPIIHGTYPEEHEPMLSSVFAFFRHRIEELESQRPGTEDRKLFQLETNFRMNEPLTAYPRRVLYRGRYTSNQPGVGMRMAQAIDPETTDLLDFLLHPDRPVVLCHYASPRSYTARNPLEADLVARLVARLRHILIDQASSQVYSPDGFVSEGLAVLSPHRAQNSTIRNVLRELGFGNDHQPLPLVDTVDKLQGQERDVILVSYGVADQEYAEAESEFLLSSNRFNVAATRARHKLIVFCSDAVLDVVPTYKATLLDSMMLKEFRDYCSDGHSRYLWSSPDGDVNLYIRWKGFGM